MTKQADEERTGFDDWLPVRAEYIAPGEYKIVTCGGLPLWYMEGAALSEWICERINAIPDPGAVSGQEAFTATLDDLLDYIESGRPSKYPDWREHERRAMVAILSQRLMPKENER
jgi:hypothetical protein